MTSPLNPSLLSEMGLTAGSAAVATELRKHSANDAKCSELGWTCIPLVWSHIELGAGKLSKLSQDLLHTLPQECFDYFNTPKSKVVSNLYDRLN